MKSKNNFKTEQEEFWSGKFGDEYTKRNESEDRVISNLALYTKIFSKIMPVTSLIELGAGSGLNLKALKQLFPSLNLAAIEINPKAANKLAKIGNTQVFNQSLLEFKSNKSWDVSLIRGVLIHINPEALNTVYELLYKTSKRYVIIIEYYNPKPVEVEYRGHQNRLFKRDFAGEMLDKYKDLKLLDYGFVYHRDNNFPQDDVTWFLMEKTK